MSDCAVGRQRKCQCCISQNKMCLARTGFLNNWPCSQLQLPVWSIFPDSSIASSAVVGLYLSSTGGGKHALAGFRDGLGSLLIALERVVPQTGLARRRCSSI
ncbi:hypothetical protein CB0940_01161 [Cercospora beticola]|uniref:Uncharacterized protein n=1 Tax=Cercospora beticola TaxID=122368 RepID=A0A2G5ICK6_CERBT|nr:hypothetical protein CB0940_01161 [Cercospora beticola]PIB02577.1 hypothetical protein CB0940_01161 [Cercospora beticola]